MDTSHKREYSSNGVKDIQPRDSERDVCPSAIDTADMGFSCAAQELFRCSKHDLGVFLREIDAGPHLTQGMDPAWRGVCALGAGVDAFVAEPDELWFGDAVVLDCGAAAGEPCGARSWATWT